MVAALADSLFRIPLTRPFVKNFFRLFSNFFASVPRRSPPGEQLVYFTTLPSPCQRLFSLFSTFFNALQSLSKSGLISPLPSYTFPSLDIYDTLFLYWTNVGQGSAWGGQSKSVLFLSDSLHSAEVSLTSVFSRSVRHRRTRYPFRFDRFILLRIHDALS